MIAVAALVVPVSAMPTVRAAEPDKVELDIVRLEHAINDAYAANKLDEYIGYYADDLSAIFYNYRTTIPITFTQGTKSNP